MTKARFGVPEQRVLVQRVLAHALDVLLRLLHPMIPFLTEEVWHLLATVAPQRGYPDPSQPAASVCIARWPAADPTHQNKAIEKQFAQFQAVLGAIREIRTRQNVPPKETIPFSVHCEPATAEQLEPMKAYFAQMARAEAMEWGPQVIAGDQMASVTLTGSSSPIEVHVDISAFIDLEVEQARLEKQRDELSRHIVTMEKKLANENFTQRAPAAVVQQQRDKLAEAQGQLVSIESSLAKLAT